MPLSAPNGESMSGGNPRRRHAGVSRPRRLREKVSATPPMRAGLRETYGSSSQRKTWARRGKLRWSPRKRWLP